MPTRLLVCLVKVCPFSCSLYTCTRHLLLASNLSIIGLNVEQRKRLTIGVELTAKPALLLFLDEPTSGLDSQTAWSICALLRKLADNGQAILCTIHQPSAILFQEFDRLLFLSSGGRLCILETSGNTPRC
jgi:ABC-type multidrug transport system ATPase subunit